MKEEEQAFGVDVKKDLESELIDLQMKINSEKPYTMALTTFGILIIIGSALYILFDNLAFSSEYLAFNVIGILFFISGYIWRAKDEKKLKALKENFEDLGNVQEEGERVGSSN